MISDTELVVDTETCEHSLPYYAWIKKYVFLM